jgi:transcriptional regulator with XRE-family HTH domain
MEMIGERIKLLREKAGYSQSELAKKLCVTRSSVNAWESGISAPTAVYIIELAKLFHVSTDYILGQDASHQLNLSGFTDEEVHLLYSLLDYFDQNKDVKWEPPPHSRSKT